MLSCDHVFAWVCHVHHVHCLYCVSDEWSHCLHSEIKRCAGRLKDKIIDIQANLPAAGRHTSPAADCVYVHIMTVCFSADSRLGLVGLFLHDIHDHVTGSGAAFWSWVDGDWLFCGTCVFLTMNVHPERRRTQQRQRMRVKSRGSTEQWEISALMWLKNDKNTKKDDSGSDVSE